MNFFTWLCKDRKVEESKTVETKPITKTDKEKLLDDLKQELEKVRAETSDRIKKEIEEKKAEEDKKPKYKVRVCVKGGTTYETEIFEANVYEKSRYYGDRYIYCQDRVEDEIEQIRSRIRGHYLRYVCVNPAKQKAENFANGIMYYTTYNDKKTGDIIPVKEIYLIKVVEI